MLAEQRALLMGVCLLAGYAFGNFLSAEIVARCLAGVGVRSLGNGSPSAENIAAVLGKAAGIAVLAGDILKTVAACWFCYRLAAPELGERAVLYGGLGLVVGQIRPLAFRGQGAPAAAVVCAWLVIYLPITGMLCALAGAVVAFGTGNRRFGCMLIPLLAVPVAWMQFGSQSAILILVVALLQGRQYRHKENSYKSYKKDEESTPCRTKHCRHCYHHTTERNILQSRKKNEKT